MVSGHLMLINERLKELAQLTILSTIMRVFVSSSIVRPEDLASTFQMLSTSWTKLMKVAGPLVGPKGITV
jgi:hypothetical protein